MVMLPNIFHECTRALLLFYKPVYENYGRKSAGEFFVICDGVCKNTSHKKQHQQNQTHHRKEALSFSRFSELWKRSTISFVIFGAPGKKHYVFGENLKQGFRKELYLYMYIERVLQFGLIKSRDVGTF